MNQKLLQKKLQKISEYRYSFNLNQGAIYLSKTPYYSESAKAYRFAQKRSEIALPLALFELIFYGFSLFDYLSAIAIIAKDSEVEFLLAEFETGLSTKCGEPDQAPGESAIIEKQGAECLLRSIYQ